MNSTYYVYDLESFDLIGSLVSLESGKNINFDIQRVYYIWGNSSDSIRGNHAHKDLEQVIICVSGSCDFKLYDGVKEEIITLNSPKKALYLKNKIWREFYNFSIDCILMVVASKKYKPEDYIYNKEDLDDL